MLIIHGIAHVGVGSAYNAIAYSGLAIYAIALQSMAYSGKQVVLMGGRGSLSALFPSPRVTQ